MKRLIAFILSLLFLLTFSACGKKELSSEDALVIAKGFTETLLTGNPDDYEAYKEDVGEDEDSIAGDEKIVKYTTNGFLEPYDSICTEQCIEFLINEDLSGCDILTTDKYASDYGFDSIYPSDMEFTVIEEMQTQVVFNAKFNLTFEKGEKTVKRPAEMEIWVWLSNVDDKNSEDETGKILQYQFYSDQFINPPAKYYFGYES